MECVSVDDVKEMLKKNYDTLFNILDGTYIILKAYTKDLLYELDKLPRYNIDKKGENNNVTTDG